MTIIEQIKAEIERLKTVQLKRIQEGDLVDAEPYDKNEAYNELLSFLSDLEKSEKPIGGLEEEIDRYREEHLFDIPAFQQVARHFYDLGCRRTAEKADEIEYNRQKAEERLADARKTSSNDLVEAAEKYFIKVPCSEEVKKTLIEIYKPGIDAFIAGAKWQKEQMMKGAVDFTLEFTHQITLPRHGPGFGNIGDKICVIVLPKED